MKKAIAYYRVSKKKQGESGLGLEAQKQEVSNFIQTNGICLLDEYVEIESAIKNKRPALKQAIKFCKKNKATLLISKLDRLSRNVAFIAALMESSVDFIVINDPNAGKLVLHIKAVVAEHERDVISERTKAALSAAKRRGTILGRHGKEVLSKINKAEALHFALTLEPTISYLQSCGFTSIRDIVAELNRLKIPTAHGGNHKWHVNSVHRLIQRIKEAHRQV